MNEFNVIPDKPPRVRVGADMLKIAQQQTEWYLPVHGNLDLQEEGGASIPSFNNLCKLIDKLGNPHKVERLENGSFLVSWPDGAHYLATGFEVGYLGTGPFYLARFGEKAGFGEVDDLYMKIAAMNAVPMILWSRNG